ncbi:MAG: polyprenol monophosphomannose synthase [Corynebacterium sp.]|nr:polyprenol monophosphomannose synthase [Corynebacterium sp.]
MNSSQPAHSAISGSTLVIIPTYNELENLPLITSRVHDACPEVHVLIVDDNSPDGTGELADKIAAENDYLHVLHREGKGGLLGAYIAGFEWGLERDYRVLCEMDADGSHAPEQLHLLLEEIDKGADLVIGSRYIPGGETVNWPASREYLSRLGNIYISIALGAGLSDMTAGYRAFKRELLESIDFADLSRAGYIFQVELAFEAVKNGWDVREVPITFTEREYGESKLDGSFVKSSLIEVTKWGIAHRKEQVTGFAKDFTGIAKRTARESAATKAPGKIEELSHQAKSLVDDATTMAGRALKQVRANVSKKRK